MEHRVQKAERIWRWIIELDAGSGDWSESQFDGEKNSWRRFVFSPFRAENHPSQADVFIRFIRMDTQHKKLSETWCDWFWKAICGQTVGHLVPIWETPAASESITDVWTSPNFVDSRRSQPITIPSNTYNTIQPIENLLCGSYQYTRVTLETVWYQKSSLPCQLTGSLVSPYFITDRLN